MLQLYYEGDTLQLAKGEDDDVPTFDPAVFDDAAQMVYDAGGFDASQLTDPRARKVIDATTQIINRAVETSIPHDVPGTLRYALENNGFSLPSSLTVNHSSALEYSSRLRVSVCGTGTSRIKFSGFSRQHAYAHYCLVPKDAAYSQVRISWWICLP